MCLNIPLIVNDIVPFVILNYTFFRFPDLNCSTKLLRQYVDKSKLRQIRGKLVDASEIRIYLSKLFLVVRLCS